MIGSLWSTLGSSDYAYTGFPAPLSDGPVCLYLTDKTRMALVCPVDSQGRLDARIPRQLGENGCFFVSYVCV